MSYKYTEIGTLVCKRCGKSVEMVNAGHRKYCPACANIVKKEQQKAIRKAQQEAAKQKRMAAKSMKSYNVSEIRKRQEAELNARIAKQHKQCLKCDNAHRDGGFVYCDYVARHGHTRPKGGEPGHCAGFEQRAEKKQKGRFSLGKRKRKVGSAATA